MPALNRTKKPARKDWLKPDIKAALEKAGWTFRRLSKEHGKCHSYFSDTLTRPNPNAQRILSEVIGKPASVIWPSRYEEDGTPKRGLYAGSHENGRDYLTRSVRSSRPVRNGKVSPENNQGARP